MKAFHFILIFAFAISCDTSTGSKNELTEEIARLKKENESLKNKSKKLETSISTYNQTLREIDFNLNKIEVGLTEIDRVGTRTQLEETIENRIKRRIDLVQRLMNNSAMKIRLLDSNLNDLRFESGTRSVEILEIERKMKKSAKKLIEQKQVFENRLDEIPIDISELEQMYEEQKARTEALRKMLNRAYYFSGTARELRKQKIVDADGGFIGLGRIKVLNASSSDSLFVEIEKDQTNHKIFKAKKIKLISSHPENSYLIEDRKREVVLNITNKREFWRPGNYLIVQVDPLEF